MAAEGTELKWSPSRRRRWLSSDLSVALADVRQVDYNGDGRWKTAVVRFDDGQALVFEVDGRQFRRMLESAGFHTVERGSWRRRWIAAPAGNEVDWPDGSKSVVA